MCHISRIYTYILHYQTHRKFAVHGFLLAKSIRSWKFKITKSTKTQPYIQILLHACIHTYYTSKLTGNLLCMDFCWRNRYGLGNSFQSVRESINQATSRSLSGKWWAPGPAAWTPAYVCVYVCIYVCMYMDKCECAWIKPLSGKWWPLGPAAWTPAYVCVCVCVYLCMYVYG